MIFIKKEIQTIYGSIYITEVIKMQSCELVLSISTLACAIAKDKTPDELALLAAICSQLGDTLATIAAREALCHPEGAGNADWRSKTE